MEGLSDFFQCYRTWWTRSCKVNWSVKQVHLGYTAVGCPCAHVYSTPVLPHSSLFMYHIFLSSVPSVFTHIGSLLCRRGWSVVWLSWVGIVSGCHNATGISLLDMIWRCEEYHHGKLLWEEEHGFTLNYWNRRFSQFWGLQLIWRLILAWVISGFSILIQKYHLAHIL